MSLSASLSEMKTILEQAEAEIKSLEGGKKASASRARAGLMKIKNMSHKLRKDITLHSNDMPTKKREKSEKPEKPAEPEEKPKTEEKKEPVVARPVRVPKYVKKK